VQFLRANQKDAKMEKKIENASFRELPFAGRVKMVQKWSKSVKMHLLGMCDVTRHGRNYLLRAKFARFLENAPVGDVRRDQTWPKLLAAGKIGQIFLKCTCWGP
jgi:hypothetical protein